VELSLEKSLGLALDGYFLAGDFEAAGLGRAPHGDFQLEFAADLFATSDTHFGVGDDFEPLFRYFRATDPAGFCFGIHRAALILAFVELSSGRYDFFARSSWGVEAARGPGEGSRWQSLSFTLFRREAAPAQGSRHL